MTAETRASISACLAAGCRWGRCGNGTALHKRRLCQCGRVVIAIGWFAGSSVPMPRMRTRRSARTAAVRTRMSWPQPAMRWFVAARSSRYSSTILAGSWAVPADLLRRDRQTDRQFQLDERAGSSPAGTGSSGHRQHSGADEAFRFRAVCPADLGSLRSFVDSVVENSEAGDGTGRNDRSHRHRDAADSRHAGRNRGNFQTDQPAGAECSHRGGAGRRGRAGFAVVADEVRDLSAGPAISASRSAH